MSSSVGSAGGSGGGVVTFSSRDGSGGPAHVIVKTIGGEGGGDLAAGAESAWLGLSTDDPPEALTAQLGLRPGEGLLVTYVATNSPAAKAGLQKNDVVVEFEGQKLVLAPQLRKLVRMHKEGDKVELTYFRGGKKQTASATLGKTRAGFGFFGEGGSLEGLKQLPFQLRELVSEDGMKEHLKQLQEALARAGVDREHIEVEVRKGVEQARKAVAEAMAQTREARRGLAPRPPRALEELARNGVEVDKDATVTIKSHNDSLRTMVKSDDSGTYVLVANPTKKLTAHDKDGKLVFDGEIETSEQQDKVPREVWRKVEPMLEQLNQAPAAPAVPRGHRPPRAPLAPSAPPAPPAAEPPDAQGTTT